MPPFEPKILFGYNKPANHFSLVTKLKYITKEFAFIGDHLLNFLYIQGIHTEIVVRLKLGKFVNNKLTISK